MLSRFTACWLVVLVLAPFTAPFSTCDLSTLFGRGSGRQAPIAPPTSKAVSHDAAVVNAPGFFRAGRSRLAPVFRVSALTSKIVLPSTTTLRLTASVRYFRDTSAFSTVIRV